VEVPCRPLVGAPDECRYVFPEGHVYLLFPIFTEEEVNAVASSAVSLTRLSEPSCRIPSIQYSCGNLYPPCQGPYQVCLSVCEEINTYCGAGTVNCTETIPGADCYVPLRPKSIPVTTCPEEDGVAQCCPFPWATDTKGQCDVACPVYTSSPEFAQGLNTAHFVGGMVGLVLNGILFITMCVTPSLRIFPRDILMGTVVFNFLLCVGLILGGTQLDAYCRNETEEMDESDPYCLFSYLLSSGGSTVSIGYFVMFAMYLALTCNSVVIPRWAYHIYPFVGLVWNFVPQLVGGITMVGTHFAYCSSIDRTVLTYSGMVWLYLCLLLATVFIVVANVAIFRHTGARGLVTQIRTYLWYLGWLISIICLSIPFWRYAYILRDDVIGELSAYYTCHALQILFGGADRLCDEYPDLILVGDNIISAFAYMFMPTINAVIIAYDKEVVTTWLGWFGIKWGLGNNIGTAVVSTELEFSHGSARIPS